MPICSSSIFNPIIINIIPPANSALLLYLSPNLFPIFVPKTDNIKVIIPISVIASNKFTF